MGRALAIDRRVASIVAINALATLVPLLRFNRQCGDRTCFQATQRDRLAGFLAIAVGPVIDPCQGLIDLSDQFALTVARAKFNCSIRFRRSAVSNSG